MRTLVALFALLVAGRALGHSCYVDVPVTGKLQASGYARYTDTPRDIPLFTGTPGSVSGAVRVVFPSVAGSCDFSGFAFTKASSAGLAAALAAARLGTPAPLAVTQMAGKYPFSSFDPTGGAYKLQWTVDNLQVKLDSDEVGGKVNQAKRVTSLRAAIPSGTTNVQFEVGPVYCPPNGWSADFQAPLANTPATVVTPATAGCTLRLAKATKEFSLACSKLKIDLGTVDVFFKPPFQFSDAAAAPLATGEAGTGAGARRRLLSCAAAAAAGAPGAGVGGGAGTAGLVAQGDHLQMWLKFEVAKGTKMAGSAKLAAAKPLAP